VVCQCSALGSPSEHGLNLGAGRYASEHPAVVSVDERPRVGRNFPMKRRRASEGSTDEDQRMSTQLVLITGGLTGIARAAAFAPSIRTHAGY
jgi:hypothetical protein